MKTHTQHRPTSIVRSLDRLKGFICVFICAFLLVPILGVTHVQAQELFVSSVDTDEVLRYDGTTGAFLDEFVTAGSGGVFKPYDLVFGPDGHLYVSGGQNRILRYDGTTGAFLDEFVPVLSGGLTDPRGLVFGPDGHLYVTNKATDQVLRYDGTTGAFLDVFVAAASGGLVLPLDVEFGPDGNLYLSSESASDVTRWDGTTGAIMDIFVAGGSGGLDNPTVLAFGPDGNLYISSGVDFSGQVLRYDGTTGAFIDAFVTASSGGLGQPYGLVFRDSSTGCSSAATTISALRAEVNALTTSVETVNRLNNNLTNVETSLGNENFKAARTRMKNFIEKVVNRSNYRDSNPDRILLDEAKSLLWGGANVLNSIPLE